ncbi:hypothetical protein RND71_023584 [Anisodus tanguticus]|uniref:Aminotransferase-like plant mobile domain-containing protein n=1 Tax=Anisodus tanguticus TaxID=243964 RepID=A0AAE1RSV3_9SOLA|nr:hypothetical protein RND71_023584 [Anisodus tanguticus]
MGLIYPWGSPIRGSFYEEIIPEIKEHTSVDVKDQRYIPRVCEYLFATFYYLQEGKSDNSRVSLSKWIIFWYNRALRYGPAPPQRERKSACFKSTHNPTRVIPDVSQWSKEEEGKLSEIDVDRASSLEEEVQVILKDMDCKDCLSNAMFEEHKKIERVSSIRQSLDEVKKKIEKLRTQKKNLEVLLEVTEREVRLGALTAGKEFDACNDADLSNGELD